MSAGRQCILGCVVVGTLVAGSVWAVSGGGTPAARSAASPHAGAALVASKDDAAARPSDDGRMTPALEQALRLEPSSVRSVGVYETKRGSRFEVLRGRREGSQECLVAVGYGGAGYSCGGLFARGPVAILETATGGPALEQRSDLEVVGLARPNVARIALVDSTGRTRWPQLNASNTFLLEYDAAELRAGIGPAELVAYDAKGAELQRIDLSESGS